jgi:hypothetical protein
LFIPCTVTLIPMLCSVFCSWHISGADWMLDVRLRTPEPSPPPVKPIAHR